MMSIKRNPALLVGIFLLVLSFRLFFSLSAQEFSDSTTYFNLRQVEQISETGFPQYQDDLSYSGRFLVFLPLFHYMLAFFNLFIPIWLVGKILPAIFASSVVILVYLITLDITKDKEAALFTSLISGFIPIFIENTINTVSVYTLVIPLTLTAVYSIIKVEENKEFVSLYLISTILLAITHQSVFIVILSLLAYLLMIYLEKLRRNKAEMELILFSAFFITWLSFIIFKRAFLLYGPNLVWQNMPSLVRAQLFKEFDILEAIYQIGIIPFILGFFMIYKTVFVDKRRKIYLIISLALTSFLLTWLGVIALDSGLIFMSVFLTLLFGPAYKILTSYLKKTTFAKRKNLLIGIFLLIFVFTSLLPSINYAKSSVEESYDYKEISAFEWVRANTGEDAIIFASLEEGHLINYISERKNVIDNNFLMQVNADQRLGDVNTIFTTKFETEAIRLLNKYDVDYILFSENAREEYEISKLEYVFDENCFELVYDDSTKIYKTLCKIGEER